MIYYDDVNLTDSVISPIIIAKKEINISIKREVASEIYLRCDNLDISIYVWQGNINVTNINSTCLKTFDFALYVEKDEATYYGRFKDNKFLYYFYVKR